MIPAAGTSNGQKAGIDRDAVARDAAREVSHRDLDPRDRAAIEQATATAQFARRVQSESDARIAKFLEPLLAKAQADGRDLITDIALSNGFIRADDYVSDAKNDTDGPDSGQQR
ncbi:hypothetical protein [Rudaeicoccus suwonensis]|uniref:hypothetical protein n=1 Tax=Rudaeicoccus suwonensis TaxID=657409 RepID=UPI0011A18F0A|nr:hypothetical protein [Rudaeicoccus suwonensis]